jgi:putative endonuclease
MSSGGPQTPRVGIAGWFTWLSDRWRSGWRSLSRSAAASDRPSQPAAPQQLGSAGEALAERWLSERGYRILGRNCSVQGGEIDLIVEQADTIVFVEVKTRRGLDRGHPSEAVTPAKQQQLTRLALAWLKRRGWLERRARFDVLAITWPESGEPQIEHYVAAFEPVGRGQFFS